MKLENIIDARWKKPVSKGHVIQLWLYEMSIIGESIGKKIDQWLLMAGRGDPGVKEWLITDMGFRWWKCSEIDGSDSYVSLWIYPKPFSCTFSIGE